MYKIIKIIAITVFFSFIFSAPAQAQIIDANYGEISNEPTPFYPLGKQLSKDGFHPAVTKKEERLRKKARRLTLSRKEQNILHKKDRGKEITFIEKIRYPFIARKNNKLDKLKAQANKNTKTPGYLQDANKYRLTYKEEDILDKAKTDTLDKKEEKIYKKAIRKQEKYKKIEGKYIVRELTEEEKELLKAERRNPKELTSEQKKELSTIHKKEKQNKKAKDRKHKFQLDSAIAAGAWIPSSKKKFSFKTFFSKIIRKKKRPSTYARKQKRINQRYALTENQKMALNKYEGGAFLTPAEKTLSNKARAKNWVKKEKTEKLLEKEFLKTQTPKTRKMMKTTKKKSNALRKRKKPNKFLTNFSNFFKKRR